MPVMLERPDTAVPSTEEAVIATESSRLLRTLPPGGDLKVRLGDGRELTIPCSAARLLGRILTEMSHGNAVTVIPAQTEMTTQEAADFLNVSRPHLIGLLERNRIGYRKVGTHRRIRFEDLQAYKAEAIDAGRAARDELAREAQELDMGY